MVARGLAELAVETLSTSGRLPGYLARYLPGHLGTTGLWELIGQDPAIVDALNLDVLTGEAFRTGTGELPVLVAATIQARAELPGKDQFGRSLARALAAARLGVNDDPVVQDPRLVWARLRRVTPHLTLTGHTNWVSGICAFTGPNQTTLLATTSYDHTVRIWNPTTGTQVGDPLTGHTDAVSGVCAFTGPNQTTLLATTSNDHTVRIWNPTTGIPIWGPLTGHTNAVTGVCAFTGPNQTTLLATISRDDTVRIWDPITAARVAVLNVAPSAPWCVAWTPAGLVVGCDDGVICLEWDGAGALW